MATDTTVNNLIINKLTKAQYDAIASPSDTELYLVPDEIDSTPTSGSDNPVTSGGVYTALGNKQDTLVSGTNIKTINNNSLVGSGNVTINIPSKTSDLTNDSGFITTNDIPEGAAASTTTPLMDGTAAIGTELAFARGDHRHPKDTSKLDVIQDLADIRSGAALGATALLSFTETDPTVPSWAKASSKPSYTASEVGAVPTTRKVNGKALSADITLSASDVDALPSSTVIPDAQIQSDWNQTTTTAKDYIKNKPTIPTVPTISTNITTDASSDSKTASPKAVKTYVDSVKGDTNIIETVKVNGTVLTPTNKAVDVIVPTKVSDLTNDSGFIDGMVILSYGSSTWSNFISAYNKNKVVYCRASSNANPATGTQSRLAFMAYVEGTTTPTSVEFQYYRSVKNHSASQQGDQVFVYTLKNTGVWSVIVREASTKIVAGTGLSSSYSNDTLTITANSFTESDPVFSASAAAGITSSDISNWNSKTSNIGTITGINMNGASKGTSGVVDLGTVITAHQDLSGKADKSEMSVSTSGDLTTITLKSGTSATVINAHQSLSSKQDTLVSGTNIKTVDGNSILGSGNLSTLALVVNHGNNDTTFALTPNVFHIWEEVSSLTISLATPTDSGILNEYMFQFISGATPTTLALPVTIMWESTKGELTPLSNCLYQVSIVDNVALWIAVNVNIS